MKTYGCFLVVTLISFSTISFALSNIAAELARRQLLSLPLDGDIPPNYVLETEARFTFENDRLKCAFIALNAWKEAIYSDPNNATSNWNGPDVCSYEGITCAESPDGLNETTVSGIDLNDEDIAGHIPVEIGLLKDLAFIHINSNRFCGIIPLSLHRLVRLMELDLSNNRFVGPFPRVVLGLPELIFLDVRFNEFEGQLPRELFEKKLDAVFLNNNRFEFTIPDNIENSAASVMVMGHNKFSGCVPKGMAKMKNLEEMILINSGLSGCFPEEITTMANLTLLDLSNNKIVGLLPKSLNKLKNLEEIVLGNNMFTGFIPREICTLPKLEKLVLKDNYFEGMHESCNNIKNVNFTGNCFPQSPKQKSRELCNVVLSHPINCKKMETSGCKPPKFIFPPGIPLLAPQSSIPEDSSTKQERENPPPPQSLETPPINRQQTSPLLGGNDDLDNPPTLTKPVPASKQGRTPPFPASKQGRTPPVPASKQGRTAPVPASKLGRTAPVPASDVDLPPSDPTPEVDLAPSDSTSEVGPAPEVDPTPPDPAPEVDLTPPDLAPELVTPPISVPDVVFDDGGDVELEEPPTPTTTPFFPPTQAQEPEDLEEDSSKTPTQSQKINDNGFPIPEGPEAEPDEDGGGTFRDETYSVDLNI